jgi:membrane associated rhomboid family serine protease
VLPLRDLNPTRRVPFVTYALILANIGVFVWTFLHPADELQDLFMRLSVVPVSVTENPFGVETLLDLIRSMFFHGGWLHLLGNMLYLWLFGDNLEDRMGVVLYLLLYFVSGFVAAIAQVLVDPHSQVPLVGASGAIAGILGGYLILFPGVKVRGIVPLGVFTRIATWPAWIVLGLWFVIQFLNGLISVGVDTSASGGVAFVAHVGGFVVGLVLTFLFTRIVRQPPAAQRRETLYERARRYRY